MTLALIAALLLCPDPCRVNRPLERAVWTVKFALPNLMRGWDERRVSAWRTGDGQPYRVDLPEDDGRLAYTDDIRDLAKFLNDVADYNDAVEGCGQ